jgi:hypothetical protein
MRTGKWQIGAIINHSDFHWLPSCGRFCQPPESPPRICENNHVFLPDSNTCQAHNEIRRVSPATPSSSLLPIRFR